MSAGTHRLIRDGGAVLATGADDVAEMAGAIGADAAPVARAPERPLDDLDPDSARIYDALPLRGGASVDALAEDSGIPPRSVLVALALLESAGLARADAGLWCKRRPSC
jgi:DNA processing protein